MVKIMENPIEMDDLGGFYTPIFGSTPISQQLKLPLVTWGHPLDSNSVQLDYLLHGDFSHETLIPYPPWKWTNVP